MNALNLRVSSVKTSDNVRKNAEMRVALVAMPRQYRESEQWFCVLFREAKTVPEQVSCVKQLFSKITEDPQLLQFLSDLYFASALKNPVRNQVVKLLISAFKAPSEMLQKKHIIEALKTSINRILNFLDKAEDLGNLNSGIASLSGCFENFEAGLEAIGACIAEVFPFARKSIEKYEEALNTISSPSLRNEFYLYLHNSIRFLLNCVQEFGATLVTIHDQELSCLEQHCKHVILDAEIPMDPRTNAGILLAHMAKLKGEFAEFVALVKCVENPQEIAMCVGVINTCGPEDFIAYSPSLLAICGKINAIANANATVPNILLCATRALYQISKLCLNFAKPEERQQLPNVKQMLECLISFAVAYLEHHMDSVRHICRDILRNVVAVCQKCDLNDVQQSIYMLCNADHLSLAMKCIMLQQVALVRGAEDILANCETLFTELFRQHLGRDFIVNNLYETLMLAHYKQQSFDSWYALWLSYLLSIASEQDERLSEIETLIVKAVKCDARVVQEIINSNQQDSIIPISTKLSTLWAVRKSGIQLQNYQEIMTQFSQNLQLSLLSHDDETRIMALRLLVETHKSTEPLTAMECDYFISYLYHNGNVQSPATRQKSLAMLGKALSRCQAGLYKQMKGKSQEELIANPPLELRFLKEFILALCGNLFEGANFSRRSVALQLLHQSLLIANECQLCLNDLLPKSLAPALLNGLSDSYESNKELSINMLKILSANSYPDLLAMLPSLEILKSLLISVRPTDSVTAAYQLEFLCHCCEPQLFGAFEFPAYKANFYGALKWLHLQLLEGLRLARHSILEAAKWNPLYGLLFALKHLLNSLDFKLMAKETVWREYIRDLIELSKQLTDVVAPVVNSSSPEGHLPNDFSELPKEMLERKQDVHELPEELLKEKDLSELPQKMLTPKKNPPENGLAKPCKILSHSSNISDMSLVQTTPQMVLLCAWRTVKEVSLILGHIVLYSPIEMPLNMPNYLITKPQILQIGEHFKLLLSETKHRGAFEQAYVGFSKLCCRLWLVECGDLNSLPLTWLEELMQLISQEDLDNAKICATRRSAGVPFMVQALVTAELKVGSSKALRYCMCQLFELCGNAKASSESRTHALNILRALFRCTDLSEVVGEYVAQGVMAAIRGYDASNWSEKNSSTLLFAALMTRIFGVQRTKDSENLNVRNKMTGRVFFLRYPQLYDFFLAQLEKASQLIEQQQKANALHPLLLMLSRLYPSALEGTESNLKLSEFLPFIAKCGACPELQTRQLAAKAMVAVINRDEVKGMVRQKCGESVFLLANKNRNKLNLLHGHLLQIFHLLKSHPAIIEADLIADIGLTLTTLQQQLQIKNAVILKVILDIYIEILKSLSSFELPPLVVQHLSHFSTLSLLNDNLLAFYYAVLHKSIFLYHMHIMRLTLPMEALSDYMLEPMLAQRPMEFVHSCLNVILYALAKQHYKGNLQDLINEFEIHYMEIQFVDSLGNENFQELCEVLGSSKLLLANLKRLLAMPKFYPEAAIKSYAILSYLQYFDYSLPELLARAQGHTDELKSALTMCVERVLHSKGVQYNNAEMCLEYLVQIAQPSQAYCLRLKAARSLSHIAKHFEPSLQTQHLNFVRLYLRLLMDLLMDDDYDIRDYASKLVMHNIQQDIALQLTATQKLQLNFASKQQHLVSTVTQCLLLQYTVDFMVQQKAEEDFILEVFKIFIGQSGNTIEDTSDDASRQQCLTDVEIFDKNEANVFAEPLKVVLDAVRIFKSKFQESSKILQYVQQHESDLRAKGLIYESI